MSSSQLVELDAEHQQRAHQWLGVVAADGGGGQRGGHGGVGEVVAGDPRDGGRRPVGHHGQAAQLAAAGLAVPGGGDVDGGHPAEQRGGRRRGLAGGHLGHELLALVGGQHDGGGTERIGQPLGERAELEEVEQLPDLVGVRGHHQRLGQLDRGIAAQDHHLVVLADALLVLGERGPQLGRLLVDVGEDAVQPAVGVDQLGRGLLADTRDAGQVVTRIAAQRGVLRVLGRCDAGPLGDAGLVVERVVADTAAVVEDLDVGVADELVGVAVAGHDHDVIAAGDGLLGGGGDEVVGLPAGQLAGGDAEGIEDLAHEAHLLTQDVRGRLAVGLVRRVGQVTERLLRPVERHQDGVGLLLLEHVDEHRREPEHGVRQLPTGRRHVLRQGEERPVRQRVPVEQQELHDAGSFARRLARSCVSLRLAPHGLRPNARPDHPPSLRTGAKAVAASGVMLDLAAQVTRRASVTRR